MPLNGVIEAVTARIEERSNRTRGDYMDQMRRARDAGVARAHQDLGYAVEVHVDERHAGANRFAGAAGQVRDELAGL